MAIDFDIAYREELGNRTEYEYWLLDFFRSRFFHQSEKPNSEISFIYGNTNDKGDLYGEIKISIVTRISEQDVQEALGRFRVLAFTSAFKLQDMIADWILEANGHSKWRFKEKLNLYDNLKRSGNLQSPTEFSRRADFGDAFWALFRRMEPVRSAVIHSGNLGVHSDGDIEIKDRDNSITYLSDKIQAAYVRYCWLIMAILTNKIEPTLLHEALIEGDLFTLASFHGLQGFAENKARFEAVRLAIPKSFAKQANPYLCEVDLTQVRKHVEKGFPVGMGGTLLFSLEVTGETETRNLVWSLPPERVPEKLLVLSEADPVNSQYLEIQIKE